MSSRPLSPGTRLGSYEIVAAIGAGGMGEVYRARDARLNRDVAIKVLPALLTGDPDRLARFRREAQVLASLNHSSIGAIYGFEESDGHQALVLELVEGSTLADRIREGPMRLDEALPIARQIASALEAAHEAGVVHRDLKPANVMVRPDGTVKVLDFGLAKTLGSGSTSASADDLSNSPTMTSPAMTQMGSILGTAAYMAPEQARGKPIDKRADVWAFGCVLHEMLTGRATFAGDNLTDTLAAIVRGEPDWSLLPADTPVPVRRLLRRCLAKDRKDRLPDIGTARLEIDEAIHGTEPNERGEHSTAPPRVRTMAGWLAVVFVLGVAISGLAAWRLWHRTNVSPPALRLAIDWPSGLDWQGFSGSGVGISPDGTQIAFMASRPGARSQVIVQSLGDGESHVIPGSDGAYGPFFSPDSRQVGFFSSGSLWRAPVTGGAPFEIGKVDPEDRGAAWSADGFIYSGGVAGLSRIGESGGTREKLTTADRAAGEIAHRFPAVVPGGRAILITIFKGGLDDARVAVVDLSTKRVRVVLDQPGHSAQYSPTGHLVYVRSGVLMAVRFDASRLTVIGSPKPLMNGILFNNGGAAHFAVSSTGTLVYVPGGSAQAKASLVWADRTGKVTPIDAPPDAYATPAISPDGSRLAVARFTRDGSDIVVWDFARKALTPVTRESGLREYPLWMPDGETLLFTSRPQLGSFGQMFRQRADGSSAAAQVLGGTPQQFAGSSGEYAGSVLSDGTKLFYVQAATSSDGVWTYDFKTSKTERILPDARGFPRISPDGRWLAYQSGKQIDVRPYPDVASARWTVSTNGSSPRWSRNGRELFFRTTQGIASVFVTPGPKFVVRDPQVLFSPPAAVTAFDVVPDGNHFLLLLQDGASSPTPHVVVNWFEELRRVR